MYRKSLTCLLPYVLIPTVFTWNILSFIFSSHLSQYVTYYFLHSLQYVLTKKLIFKALFLRFYVIFLSFLSPFLFFFQRPFSSHTIVLCIIYILVSLSFFLSLALFMDSLPLFLGLLWVAARGKEWERRTLKQLR